MNTEALFLFLILLLGLVLCSFLGGTCNKEGMTNQNTDSNQFRGNGNNLNFNQNSSNGASTSSGIVYDNLLDYPVGRVNKEHGVPKKVDSSTYLIDEVINIPKLKRV